MYFLTEDERKFYLKKMLPKARAMSVEEELRGWNWHQPPLEPVFEERLAIYEVANQYCPTGRDLYVRRVLKQRPKASYFMIAGRVFHQILMHVLQHVKRQIYLCGSDPDQLRKALRQPSSFSLPPEAAGLPPEQQAEISAKVKFLEEYETSRIMSRIEEILTQQPYIGADSLAHLAVPVVCENKLDGRFLGLSQYLSCDAFTFSEPMILDLKFGAPQKFHRLATTGYALAMEAIYETPVNLGCIVYGEFKDGRLTVSKDMHLIDDELRQWFIEARDERARMLAEEIDPGLAEKCSEYCPTYEVCHS